MRRFVMPVLLLTLLLVGGLAASAYGALLLDSPTYAEPADCYACHGAGGAAAAASVDFGVGPVDYAACRSCHAGMPGMGHYHFGYPTFSTRLGQVACLDCHDDEAAFEFVLPAGATAVVFPATTTEFGAFASSTSLSASVPSLHDVHTSLGWVETTFGGSCSRCHAVAACSTCHLDPVAHGNHTAGANPAVTVRQATGAAVVSAPVTCVAAGCHALTDAASTAFVPACSSCHPSASDETHEVSHAALDAAESGVACSQCHSLALVSEHGKSTSTSAASSCAACHPNPASSTAPSWDGSCVTAGCHTAASDAPMHENTASAHAVSEDNELCLDCHAGSELGSIHAEASDDTGASSCLVCHTSTAPPATSDCTVCHFTFAEHYDTSAHTSSWTLLGCTGAGCHNTRDLMGAHQEHDSAFTCDGCHKDFGVALQIQQGLTGCGDCHDNVYETSGHRAIHWAQPPLQDATGPRYSYYTGSVGTQPTRDCAGCHTSNLVDEHMGLVDTASGYPMFLPRFDSAGDALTCGTCHNSTSETVVGAIAASMTSCESCHTVHGPMQEVHVSSFVDEQVVPCADCHSSDLIAEHNGGYTSSAGLTGCDVCHALYTGEFGQRVQGAISGANDTSCSACHLAYHEDAEHQATSSASFECAACHARGAEVLDLFAIHANAPQGQCNVCHANAVLGSVSGKTFECASCHEGHGDLAEAHTARASSECVDCHESADLRLVHGASEVDSCVICHEAASGRIDWESATADCDSCHAPLSPVDPQHYSAASHTASFEAGCPKCHSADLRTEHFKATVSPSVTCVSCHEQRVDNFSTTWDKSCTVCHASKHGNQAQAHKSSNTSCAGSGCHVVTDVSVLHGTKCEACHTPGITPSTDCTKCHTGSNPHHATITLNMSTSSQWQTVCGTCHGRVHSWGTCLNCHSRDMHGESRHIDQNSKCVACHKVAAADASDNCLACHSNLGDSSGSGWGGGGSWGDGSGWGGGSTSTSGAVSGTITSSATGAISGATVSIAGKTATTGSAGAYSITDIATGTYTMSVTATGYNTWFGSVTISSNTTVTQNVTLTAVAPTSTNLARSGSASASSTDGWNYAASKAMDGRTDTYWRSSSGGTQWLRVDLGAAKTFDKVVVNWYSSGYARSYRIDTSNDGSNWTSRYTTTYGDGGVDTITFASVSARYVRVYCTSANDSDYRITEFEVWGY